MPVTVTPQTALDYLPDSNDRDEIASFLESHGIVGYLESPELCPVACWLRRMTGIKHVEVGESEILAGLDDSGSWQHVITTPVAVRRFLRTFDNGGYPFLLPHLSDSISSSGYPYRLPDDN